MANAILKLLQDDEFYKRCKENAENFASELSWDKIYDHAFSETLKLNVWDIGLNVLDYQKRILSKAGIKPNDQQKLLDVGCGDGSMTVNFSQNDKEVVGIDIKPYSNWQVFKTGNLHFVVADACNLPFLDSIFDIAFEKDALHHIESHKKALNEIKRVTRTGGQVIILEANRHNPVLYLHMTLMKGHQHFTKKHFENIVASTFKDATFMSAECHVYPIKSKLIHFIEDFLGKIPLVNNYLSYNIAVMEKKN